MRFQSVRVDMSADAMVLLGFDLVVDRGWLSYNSVWSMIVVGQPV